MPIRAAALCLLVVTAPLLAPAQQAGNELSSDKATIQALLVEVRQLRLALERSTSILPRVQLAAQRLQAQQDRVDRLSRELRNYRADSDSKPGKEKLALALKQIESEMGQTQDAARRKEMENVSKSLAAEIEQVTFREQQDRAQEIELMSQLQSEQAKLRTLSDQLDALEKKLEEVQPAPRQ